MPMPAVPLEAISRTTRSAQSRLGLAIVGAAAGMVGMIAARSLWAQLIAEASFGLLILEAGLSLMHRSRFQLADGEIATAKFQRPSDAHPVTGLDLRERLFRTIDADLASAGGPRLLGVLRLVDFDRIAAFDREAANLALRSFARRLRSSTKASHLVAQIDRDCFCVWYRQDDDLEKSISEFRALAYLAGEEIADGDGYLTPTIEAGLARYPFDGADPAQLLTWATAALARPEVNREGGLQLAETGRVQDARDSFVLEQELAQAIIKEQLTMRFQPVVNLLAGRVIGAEALLRWDHPKLGAVSPARFIPIVEKIGLSDRFGLWVLNAACREAAAWREAGLTGLRVAVNLSAKQLADPDLRQKLERTLQRHRLEPSALELELTETAAMADAGRTHQLFSDLRAMGISLAIDDFGSGYSSLSYLKTLPFDKLKIDREFVAGIDERRDSQAICKALIELGRGLGLSVLAEGVENLREVSVLQELGCDIFQGYHFSKPLSGEDFRAFAGKFQDRSGAKPKKRAPV